LLVVCNNNNFYLSPFPRYYHITVDTVVPAVVKANSQINGKGQISTARAFKTPERISVKLGIYNYAVRMTTHANPCGAATTWVVCVHT